MTRLETIRRVWIHHPGRGLRRYGRGGAEVR